MIKIKAKYDIGRSISHGKVYEAYKVSDGYTFINDYGNRDYAHESHFTVIPNEPAIEVGSEWFSQNNVTWKVVYSGKSIVVTHGNTENTLRREKFLEKYKPKPKTVTMYFYRQHTERLFASEFPPNFTETLFTREIELP